MTGHEKKLQNGTWGQKENQSIATDPEVRSMGKLADNDFKAAGVNIFKYLKSSKREKKNHSVQWNRRMTADFSSEIMCTRRQ